ncbi:hypothetical protein AAC691_00410 [Nguyenibacter vanlangensis]|uniref:Aldehyde oxidase/xanthine dehydrogenase second molybdopterin binding domain-containing protein n=1 Tax=Nguyenibacter vanlangensis TaxID=1216886 RepID=A0ABZ3D5C9_9PROT
MTAASHSTGTGLTAQIEGGILFGLSAALHGKIIFENGGIEQSNFHDFSAMRINETHRMDTFIINSSEEPGGIGEVGTTAASPSLGNALSHAARRRYRFYPFRPLQDMISAFS